jgi:hypothetical protein
MVGAYLVDHKVKQRCSGSIEAYLEELVYPDSYADTTVKLCFAKLGVVGAMVDDVVTTLAELEVGRGALVVV